MIRKYVKMSAIGFFFFLLTGFFWITVTITLGDVYREAEIISEVRQKILKNYFKEVSPDKLLDGALQGMVDSLEDEYSQYLNAQQYKNTSESIKGEFVGIGIELVRENDSLVIIAPIEDSPAAKAGILPGDKILAIYEESTEKMSLRDAVSRMQGKKGETLVLTILHEGSTIPQKIEIIRDTIKIESVKDAAMIDNEIGYLRLVKFSDNTKNSLRTKIKELSKQGMKSLILDLRANPGGSLEASVEVVRCFIKDGVIVSIKGKNSKEDEIFVATGEDVYEDFPLVVLVNKRSASASEVVAGALQDYHRAVIVGTRTYGKGVVQTIFPLKGGKTALKLTTATYYTPAGRNIHKEPGQEGGIEPDILIPISLEEERALTEKWKKREGVKSYLTIDRQLQTALEVLKKAKSKD